MTGQLPLFSLKPTPIDTIVKESNVTGSSVFLMIETKESIHNIDEIAAVKGVDVLLIGSNDLAIELGVPGQFRSPEFRSALERVSRACVTHKKILGLAGIYGNIEIHDWAVNTLGARFILGQQDSGILVRAGKEVVDSLSKIATT